MQGIEALLDAALVAVGNAETVNELDDVRVRYLGKKGAITAHLKSLKEISPSERREAGQALNTAKQAVLGAVQARRKTLEAEVLDRRLAGEALDVTLPGRGQNVGGRHPVTRTLARIERLFEQVGFVVAEGPEIEDDYHNFDALNIPAEHPARAMHDTFYAGAGAWVLRTHTSPVQVRV